MPSARLKTAIPALERPQTYALGRLHTHRLFAGVGSGSGRGGFHTYRHYRCRRCFKETEVFKSVVGLRQVQIRVISRTKKMFVRRPACRVPVRHANLPGRQLGRTGCVWKHPFIYIASGVGVGPGSVLPVCVQTPLLNNERQEERTSQEQEAIKMIPLGQRATMGQVTACLWEIFLHVFVV